MRENCTYGLTRGRAHPTRGVPLYSTSAFLTCARDDPRVRHRLRRDQHDHLLCRRSHQGNLAQRCREDRLRIRSELDKDLRVARGSGTGEYVEVNMSLRMAAELKSGRRPRGTRLAAMVVFV